MYQKIVVSLHFQAYCEMISGMSDKVEICVNNIWGRVLCQRSWKIPNSHLVSHRVPYHPYCINAIQHSITSRTIIYRTLFCEYLILVCAFVKINLKIGKHSSWNMEYFLLIFG